MNLKMRLIVAILFVASVLIGAWVAGFEWVRGSNALMVYITSLLFGCIGFACPIFDKK